MKFACDVWNVVGVGEDAEHAGAAELGDHGVDAAGSRL
jgi:hypothetical protein